MAKGRFGLRGFVRAVVSVATLSFPSLAAASSLIGTAPFVSPSSAATYYGTSTTSTNSTGESARPKEVIELARALKGDVDLIYEHVRDNAETVWAFGLSKGAMGVIVDRAGTSFDQAHLMVELLRQSGKTASYKIGTITLSGAEFEAWTGITSAKAACQLLSSGGIPGSVNGATTWDCNYGSATVSTITLTHAWVATTINGTEYLFDPAYKPHTFKSGLNLTTATGMSGATIMANLVPMTGSQSGVDWVSNAPAVDTYLSNYTNNLENHLAANAPAAGLDDVIGGQTITPQSVPTTGLRQTSLPYASTVTATISGNMPNQYRIRLGLLMTKKDNGTPVDSGLYVDEIYGRRLIFDPNFDTTGASFSGQWRLVDDLGNATNLWFAINNARDPTYSKGELRLVANMPYAANSGGYMDRTFWKNVDYALPMVVLHGWGDTGRGLIDKWGQRKDTPMPAYDGSGSVLDYSYYKGAKGDGRRELLAASFLAQSSKAARIHAQIAKSIYAQHYMIGVVSADTTVGQNTAGKFWITDSLDRLEYDVGYSITSKTATAADRRAAAHATADTIAALAGSVQAQVSDLPDVASVATRFEWGNAPESGTDPNGSNASRKVYRFTNATQAGQAPSLVKVDGLTTTSDDGVHADGVVEMGSAEVTARKLSLSTEVANYVGWGFQVTASEEAALGPGARAGAFNLVSGGYSHDQSKQRGGALIANKYDGSGDPTEIVHVLIQPNGRVDGAGGGVQTYHSTQYDPAYSADVVRGRWIDGQLGLVTAVSPATVTSGQGAFPYSLTGTLTWRGSEVRDETYGKLDHHGPQGGWTTNFNNSLTISGSGLATMEDFDARASVGTVSRFAALQDIYRSAPELRRELLAQLVMGNWAKTLQGNVATVSVGANVRQFLRKPNGTWFAPGAGDYTQLIQTGARTITTRLACHSSGRYIPTRGWDYSAVSFQVTAPQGDIQTFSNWSQDFNPTGAACGTQRGFRLTTWTWPKGVNLTFSYTNASSTEPGKLEYVANNQSQRLNLINGGLGGFNNNLSSSGKREVNVTEVAGQPVTHTDPIGAVSKFAMVDLGLGNYQRKRLDAVYAADDSANPALRYVYDALGRLSESKDKLAIAGTRLPVRMLIANGLRVETVDSSGSSSVIYRTSDERRSGIVDPLGNTTRTTLDGRARILTGVSADGDETTYEYNTRNQVTKLTRKARPGSAEVGQTIVTEAGWDATWNLPSWTKDARGAQTDYTYESGELKTTTYPAPLPGESRSTEQAFYYASGLTMSLYRPMGESRSFTYSNVSLNGMTQTLDLVSNSYVLNLNSLGDPTLMQRPRGGQITIEYDALRHPTLQVEPQPSQPGSARRARKTTYDRLGRVTKVELGSYSGSTFTPLETHMVEYDAIGNKIKDIGPSRIIQYSIDAANRPVCTAVRMNPEAFSTLPSDACVQGPEGKYGPDRISRMTYDAAGRVVLSESGVGTSVQQVTARYTYSPGGQQTSLTDANGNKSTFEYDGFGRLTKTRFPASPRGSGVSSTTDYELKAYDLNGNVTSFRRRSGKTISYSYDALNRLTVKDLPDTTDGDSYFKYRYNGKVVEARLGSATSSVFHTLNFDEAGRLLSDTATGVPLWIGGSAAYDADGNRTRVMVDNREGHYTYDLAGRLTEIAYATTWNGPKTTVLSYTYDPLGRVTRAARPNGIDTTYSYDPAGRLVGLAHAGASPTAGSYQTFEYNPLGQLIGQSQASPQYVWSGQPTTTTNFTHDALNRDAAVVAAMGYDADGNLTSDGTRTFAYDAENRLTSVTGGPANVSLVYDPFGRLEKTIIGGVENTYSYFAEMLLEENNRERAYVHGLGPNAPLIWLDGTGNTPEARYLHMDRLGSVIGVSSSGGAITPYTYGPYGEPQTWAGSRFRYTGQIAIPEAQLYHYKARAYDPMRGHFLQNDPIGYGDGPNMYAYVRGDPLNATDPSGMAEDSTVEEIVVTALKKARQKDNGDSGGGRQPNIQYGVMMTYVTVDFRVGPIARRFVVPFPQVYTSYSTPANDPPSTEDTELANKPQAVDEIIGELEDIGVETTADGANQREVTIQNGSADDYFDRIAEASGAEVNNRGNGTRTVVLPNGSTATVYSARSGPRSININPPGSTGVKYRFSGV